MASKKKTVILRCTDVKFAKNPTKDRKGATLAITFETSSGKWTQKKQTFEDIFKFVEATCKQPKNKKSLGQFQANMSKYKDEYLNKSKEENAFKLISDIFNQIGKNKKILTNDSKITAFIGAKRDHLTDIKTAQKISKNKKPKTTSTFASSLGGPSSSGKRRKTTNTETDEQKTIELTTDESESNNQESKPDIITSYKQKLQALSEEMENMKRKHMSSMYSLKQENSILAQSNALLKETAAASQETQHELEQKIMVYEKELGKNEIDEDMASLFAEEFKKEDNLAEKYYKQVKAAKGTIDTLTAQLMQLTGEKEALTKKLSRATYTTEQLASEVHNLHNPNLEQLENDYREVEAELDEITTLKENYERQMTETAQELDLLGIEVAKMKPKYEEYPHLVEKLDSQRQEMTALMEKFDKLQNERDEFEDKYLKFKSAQKETVSREEYNASMKRYKEQIKELNGKESESETAKNTALAEMESMKEKMAEFKIKFGELSADNDRLLRGGGRDINLDLNLDLENDFSLFKKDEFEYPQNVSRDQLILWCEHFKLLIKEINEELCGEINDLSERNETLEHYIEVKGLPFPEDDSSYIMSQNKEEINNKLPHPLPSMNFIEDLDEFNPTKKQLKEYIDLMFNEWRNDEMDAQEMVMACVGDKQLLNELENELQNVTEEKSENTENESETLKKQLERAYLKEEEVTLEFNKQMNELKEINQELSKQLRVEQQKNMKTKDPSEMTGTLNTESKEESKADTEVINESHNPETKAKIINTEPTMEDTLLLNRLRDTESYVKDLEDNLKQIEFETTQQKQIIEREYKYDIEILNIDLENARNNYDDLAKQVGSDNLNLLASEFRNELEDHRKDIGIIQKQHIEEIRELERDRDELLRETNLLRIKTDRMDMNSDEVFSQMQTELDKKDKELQHFEAVASNLSNVKEKLDTMEADRNELEKSYQELKQKSENEKQIYLREIHKANLVKNELLSKYEMAQKDIENIKRSEGIDSDAIITTTELVKMKEYMNDLKVKRTEAVKSKIKLLETSSLEIERMRDEIKILNQYMKQSKTDRKRAHKYGNGHRSSVSSMGSSVPSHYHNTEDNDGYMGSAWNYTLGIVSSIGNAFGTEKSSNNSSGGPGNRQRRSVRYRPQRYFDENEIDIQTDYDYPSNRSSLSNGIPQSNNNGQRNSKFNHYSQPSMAGSYAGNAVSHVRGASAAVYKAKRERNQRRNGNKHGRKPSRHRPIAKRGQHIPKQASKQDMMLNAEENDNIRDSMAKIFNAFDNYTEKVNDSMDFGASGVATHEMDMFSLDDMIDSHAIDANDNGMVDQIGINNGMSNIAMGNNEELNDEYFENILNNSGNGGIGVGGGVGDDFWGTNMANQNDINVDVDIDENMNQYSDDDRFGIGAMDL